MALQDRVRELIEHGYDDDVIIMTLGLSNSQLDFIKEQIKKTEAVPKIKTAQNRSFGLQFKTRTVLDAPCAAGANRKKLVATVFRKRVRLQTSRKTERDFLRKRRNSG